MLVKIWKCLRILTLIDDDYGMDSGYWLTTFEHFMKMNKISNINVSFL